MNTTEFLLTSHREMVHRIALYYRRYGLRRGSEVDDLEQAVAAS